MSNATRTLFVALATTTALAAAAFSGCSAGVETETSSDGVGGSAPAGSSTSGQGGAGAEGGGGGAGGGGNGAGGDSLCDIDCSSIETADCLQAVCNEGMYPGPVGSCVVIDAPEGTACEDGMFCTVNDSCSAGQCQGGPANDCGLLPEQCFEVACDEAAKSCSSVPALDGSPCTSADMCQVNATCTAGQCLGQPKDCFFAPVPDECHVAVCNPADGMCIAVEGNDGQPCTDQMDLCTVNKVCSNGTCQGGAPMDCSALTVGCQMGVCDTANGQCVPQAIGDGNSCDDGDFCTLNDVCTMGMCGSTTVVSACQNGDLCCPTGCNETNDSDCILDILLMGDDVADQMGQAGWPDYRAALTAAGVTWAEHNLDVTTTFPTPAQLQQYNTVIWFDASSIAQTNADCQVMADWLTSPGMQRLFVTSYDFMWDFATATAGTGENNLYQLWGATYAGDSAGSITSITTVMGDPITGSFAPNPLSISGVSMDYADPNLGPATHAGLYGPGGAGTGFSALSHHSNADYRVVWLGVNFHNHLTVAAERNQLMTNIINYFK